MIQNMRENNRTQEDTLTVTTEVESSAREVFSPLQAADYLGCGRTYLYKLMADGDIPSFKLGKLRRIRRKDLAAYVEERAGEQGQ